MCVKDLPVCVCVCVCVQEFADELCLRRSRLPPEPASVSDATVLISLRLPSGDRMERRFNNTDQLQVIAVHTYTCTTYYITHARIVCVYMCLYYDIVYVLRVSLKTFQTQPKPSHYL